MDQDYNKLLEKFSRSIVRICIYHWDKFIWDLHTIFPGIVTMSGSDFCHIVVCNRGFLFDDEEQSEYAYEVIFPDETSVELDVDTVQESDRLVAFFVRTEGKKVDAVQFNQENASCREKVWMFGYNLHSQSLLDDGTITHVGDEDFTHDVPANSMCSFGYPLFNMENNLIGIGYFDYGVTSAINVTQMRGSLSRIFNFMIDKPLVEIIEHIKVLGEAKYPQLQDSI